MFKLLKRLSMVLIVLIICFIGLHVVENSRGKKVWERVISETEAKGISLDWNEYIPEPIPDELNLTKAPVISYWIKTDQNYPFNWLDQWGSKEALMQVSSDIRTIIDAFDASPEQLARLTTLIQPYRSLLQDVRDACESRPNSRIEGNYSENPFESPPPPFGMIRSYTSLLAAEAMLSIHEKENDLLQKNVSAIERLSNLSPDSYSLMASMIEIVVQKGYIIPIHKEGIGAGIFSNQELEAILTTCTQYNAIEKLEQAYRYEIVAGYQSARHLIDQDKLFDSFHLGSSNDNSTSLISFFLENAMPEGWRWIMFSRVLHYHSRLIDPIDVENRRFDPAISKANKEVFNEVIEDYFPFNILVAMSLPAFEKIEEQVIVLHKRKDMCGIDAALELYRRTNAELPLTLDALEPTFISSLHHDPITRDTYQYKRVNNETYHLGSIETDDYLVTQSDVPNAEVPAASNQQITEEIDWKCEGASIVEISPSKPVVFETETISVDFPDEKVRIIIRNVADLYDLNLVIPDTLNDSVRTSVKLRDIMWPTLFDAILEPAGYTWYREANIIRIITYEEIKNQFTDEIIHLDNLSFDNVRPILKSHENEGLIQKLGTCEDSSHIHFKAHLSYARSIKYMIESLDASGYHLEKTGTNL